MGTTAWRKEEMHGAMNGLQHGRIYGKEGSYSKALLQEMSSKNKNEHYIQIAAMARGALVNFSKHQKTLKKCSREMFK